MGRTIGGADYDERKLVMGSEGKGHEAEKLLFFFISKLVAKFAKFSTFGKL
jgi:hypothetical protein